MELSDELVWTSRVFPSGLKPPPPKELLNTTAYDFFPSLIPMPRRSS